MHDPAEQDEPEQPCEYEVADGGDEAALQELAESWEEEAAECCDYVSGCSLSVHDFERGVEFIRSARISRSSLVCGRMKLELWLG